MPTTLPRTNITHTPAVQRALAMAERRWPGDSPRVLLTNIATEWTAQMESIGTRRREERQARIRAGAGSVHGVYDPDYLTEIREGWRE